MVACFALPFIARGGILIAVVSFALGCRQFVLELFDISMLVQEFGAAVFTTSVGIRLRGPL